MTGGEVAGGVDGLAWDDHMGTRDTRRATREGYEPVPAWIAHLADDYNRAMRKVIESMGADDAKRASVEVYARVVTAWCPMSAAIVEVERIMAAVWEHGDPSWGGDVPLATGAMRDMRDVGGAGAVSSMRTALAELHRGYAKHAPGVASIPTVGGREDDAGPGELWVWPTVNADGLPSGGPPVQSPWVLASMMGRVLSDVRYEVHTAGNVGLIGPMAARGMVDEVDAIGSALVRRMLDAQRVAAWRIASILHQVATLTGNDRERDSARWAMNVFATPPDDPMALWDYADALNGEYIGLRGLWINTYHATRRMVTSDASSTALGVNGAGAWRLREMFRDASLIGCAYGLWQRDSVRTDGALSLFENGHVGLWTRPRASTVVEWYPHAWVEDGSREALRRAKMAASAVAEGSAEMRDRNSALDIGGETD